jgi:hypothetical protein
MLRRADHRDETVRGADPDRGQIDHPAVPSRDASLDCDVGGINVECNGSPWMSRLLPVVSAMATSLVARSSGR